MAAAAYNGIRDRGLRLSSRGAAEGRGPGARPKKEPLCLVNALSLGSRLSACPHSPSLFPYQRADGATLIWPKGGQLRLHVWGCWVRGSTQLDTKISAIIAWGAMPQLRLLVEQDLIVPAFLSSPLPLFTTCTCRTLHVGPVVVDGFMGGSGKATSWTFPL